MPSTTAQEIEVGTRFRITDHFHAPAAGEVGTVTTVLGVPPVNIRAFMSLVGGASVSADGVAVYADLDNGETKVAVHSDEMEVLDEQLSD